MEDLLSTLGVVNQSEQVSADKILHDKFYQSVSFPALEPYLLENIVKAKVDGLPKLSVSSLRTLSKDVSSQHSSRISDVDKLAHMIQERFLIGLIEKETKGKSSGTSNRASIQSILNADLSSADRRPLPSESHEERRAVKLLSMEDLKNQRRNDVTNSYNYRRGSSGVPFADHKYSLNIHASMSNAPTYAEKLDEETIENLMEEARAENTSYSDGFVDVTQTAGRKRTKSDFLPKKDRTKPVKASDKKSTKPTRREVEDSDGEAEFDENELLSSSSSAPPRKLRAREVEEVDPVVEQTKRSRVTRGATAVPTSAVGARRSARVKLEPAIVADSDDSDLVCPICSRVVEVAYSRAAKRNAELAVVESAEAMDRHVERCSRRRTATVGAVYSENTQGVDESVFHEKIVHGANNTGSSSSSSNIIHDKKKGGSREDAIQLDDDEEVEGVNDDFEEEYLVDRDSNRRNDSNRSMRRDRSGSARSVESDRIGRAKKSHKEVVSEGEENEDLMKADDDVAADQEYEVSEGENAEMRQSGDENDDGSDGSSSEEEGSVVRMVYASDDWEDDHYVRRLQALTEEQVATVPTEYGTEVNQKTFERLYDYQKEGCRWMFELYQEGVGGILGDEMGLGKTAQLCTHFDSLSNLQLRANRNNRLRTNNSALFLVVCPATVLQHWLNEFRYWAPRMRSVILHSISTTGHELGGLGDAGVELVLKKLRTNRYSQGIVVITTFEGMRKHKTALTLIEWTAVCLDEGQKIRNPTADITVICKTLPAFHRMILSGTPIQNNLRELWSLFDFIYPGRIGQLDVFEAEFSAPIRIGGYLNASKLEYEIAIRCAATLQRIIKPYLLRRKKDDLALVTKLPPKTEQVLFCQISPMQKDIYLNVLSSSEVHAVLERRAVAFRAINTLRKLCNHPALMFNQGKVRWHTDGTEAAAGRKKKRHTEDEGIDSGGESDDLEFLQSVSQDEGRIKWSDSGKLLVLSKVLPLWHSEGHKVLIFTQTRGMLNIIESMVRELQFNYRRLDGSTPVNKRAAMIDNFNNNKNIFVMLLTTRTGGVGVSLTSANRVVVFDPDWNPMTDIQSRERAWRLGQRREVTIYRLITRGTIEEKIYQRQIFKLLLSNRILDNPKQKALFTKNDIKELFVLNDSATASNNISDTRSTLSGSSANSGSRLSLPEGGHVNIHSAVSIRGAAAVEATAAPYRIGIAEVEEGEVLESSSSNDVRSEVEVHFDVEDYVQQALPTKLIDRVQQTVPGEGSSGSNANAGSVDRDRRLLAALFNGEAITSVYDHDYLESHPDSNTGGNRVSKETATNRAMAFKVVGQKLQNIANSNAAAASRNSSSDARVLKEVEHQLTGSEPQLFGSSSSRMERSSSFGNIGASGSLTSRFTNHSASGGSGAFSSAALLNTMRSNGTAALQAVPVVNLKNSVFSSVSNTQPRVSVQQDITNRLLALFDDSASVYNQNPDKNGPAMYSTLYIVNRFKDLGDQYAPVFKECLRIVATNNNGIWSKK